MSSEQPAPSFNGFRAIAEHIELRNKLENYVNGISHEPPPDFGLTQCDGECLFAQWLHNPGCKGLKDIHLHNQLCNSCEVLQSVASEALLLMGSGKNELAKEVLHDDGAYATASDNFQRILTRLHHQLNASTGKQIESDFESRLFEIKATTSATRNMRHLSILIVGDATSAEGAKRLLEDNTEPDVRVMSCAGINESLALIASDISIALVLLLWQGDSPGQLPDLVQSIFERQSNHKSAVMVRSQTKLPEDIHATLWDMGVVDRSFYQPVLSADLIDSVAVAMRNYRRQIMLTDITALSGILSGAKTLRDLALLSLIAVHEQKFPTRSGLFCYLDDSARPMIIAGTGLHANQCCMPLERMESSLPKKMIQNALGQCRSQFSQKGAAIYLLTPGGYTACIYFTLDLPLHPWEIGVLRTISHIIVTAIDQSMLAQHLLRTQHATITALSTIAEYRDVDTGEHVARVARMTTEISQMLSQENEEIDSIFLEQVGLASVLHDTGKIAIPDDILLKPGPLDSREHQVMEQHAILGHDILKRALLHTGDGGLLNMSAEIARSHHERFDGTGYPDRLKGEDIPLSARIVALVDVYDALTCRRPYKLPWPHEQVVELIRSESGKHFDPKVVDAFLRLDGLKKSARYIEWSDAMSVGNDELDLDHRQLIEIINRLWVANSMGNRQITEFVLNDLVNYTEFHFAREERLLEQVGFLDIERHFDIHKSICHRLDQFRWEYFHGIRDELREGLLEFVTAWLNQHILEEDMRYSSHFGVAAKVKRAI